VTIENIEKARAEARKFMDCAHIVLSKSVRPYTDMHGRHCQRLDTGKNTGSLRRASLDLTRSLAEMRKPWNPLIPSAT
jgi:hypothetical protein